MDIGVEVERVCPPSQRRILLVGTSPLSGYFSGYTTIAAESPGRGGACGLGTLTAVQPADSRRNSASVRSGGASAAVGVRRVPSSQSCSCCASPAGELAEGGAAARAWRA